MINALFSDDLEMKFTKQNKGGKKELFYIKKIEFNFQYKVTVK